MEKFVKIEQREKNYILSLFNKNKDVKISKHFKSRNKQRCKLNITELKELLNNNNFNIIEYQTENSTIQSMKIEIKLKQSSYKVVYSFLTHKLITIWLNGYKIRLGE